MEHSRRKSCRRCRVAKARCSLGRPFCSRCEIKNLPCKYDNAVSEHNISPQARGSRLNSSVAASDLSVGVQTTLDGAHNLSERIEPLTMRNSLSSITELSGFNLSPMPALDSRLEIDWHTSGVGWAAEATLGADEVPREQVASSYQDSMEQDFQESLSWLEFVSGSIESSMEPNVAQDPDSIAIPAEDGPNFLSQASLAVHRSAIFQASSHFPIGAQDNASNLFNLKRNIKVSSAITGKLLWATIKSYVNRFADGGLPPFIHRCCGAKEWNIHIAGSADLSEPLENCSTIVSLYQKRSSGNTSLVFKTLLLEIHRLYDKFRKHDERTLLQAVQALTIYVIMVAADTDRYILISITIWIAVYEMASELSRDGDLSMNEAQAGCLTWQEWIQAESKRRTLLLLHLLGRILDIDIVIPHPQTCSSIDCIPLPCSSRLWEADTRLKWESEYSSYLSTRKDSRILTIKSLRESYQMGVVREENRAVQDLLRWSEDVDGMGSMLLMAFSNL